VIRTSVFLSIFVVKDSVINSLYVFVKLPYTYAGYKH